MPYEIRSSNSLRFMGRVECDKSALGRSGLVTEKMKGVAGELEVKSDCQFRRFVEDSRMYSPARSARRFGGHIIRLAPCTALEVNETGRSKG